MSEPITIRTIRIRRDIASNWTQKNPILKLGEPGLETDTRKLKFGDGTSPWNNLQYSGGDGTIDSTVLLESIDDRVADLIKAGSNISVVYDDTTDSLTINASLDSGDISFSGIKIIGSGENSGDGNGYGTIELVPDNSLYNNDQYVVIDPTQPSHIHIRAGGTQDASNAELIFGGEKNNVVVNDNSGIIINNTVLRNDDYDYYSPIDFADFDWLEEDGNYFIRFFTTNPDMVNRFWESNNGQNDNQIIIFDGATDYFLKPVQGNFSNPAADVYKAQVVEASQPIGPNISRILFRIYTENFNRLELRNNDFRIEVTDDLRMYSNDAFRLYNNSSESPIQIITNYDNDEKRWDFNADGSLNLPDGKPINWGQNLTTLGPPVAGGGSDRIRLWDFRGEGTNFNYAIGAEGNHMWFTMDVNNGTGGFKFYSRDNQIFKIRDDGALIFADSTIQTTAYGGVPTIGDISGLQAALDNKANTSHNHNTLYRKIQTITLGFSTPSPITAEKNTEYVFDENNLVGPYVTGNFVINDPSSASLGDAYIVNKPYNTMHNVVIGGVTYDKSSSLYIYRYYALNGSTFSWKTVSLNPVQSVAGKTGNVTLTKGDVGLSNVDNTSDLNKPISTATQTALATKQGNVVTTIAYASTITTNAASGDIFDITLSGNTTLANPTNPVNGKTITWRITQSATGENLVALGDKFVIPDGVLNPLPWSISANKTDMLTAMYHGGKDKWYIIGFIAGY